MTTRDNLIRTTSLYTMTGLSDPRLTGEARDLSNREQATTFGFIIFIQKLFSKPRSISSGQS